MCRFLGVQISGYYNYAKRKQDQPEDPVHEEMIIWILDITELSVQT